MKNNLFLSLLTGAIVAGLMAWVFYRKDSPQLLAKSHKMNEELWKAISSNRRMSVEKDPPPVGTKPRVNGLLGLSNHVSTQFFDVYVDSVTKRVSVPIAEFRLLPKVGYATDFRCIEGWSEVIHYAGVRFSEFMEKYELGKKEDGTYYQYVALETPDRGYYVSIDMESMLHPQTLLSYEMNGAPLSIENGAPLRLIIPIKYGIKSIKRVGKIYFSDTRPPDYWAERGYDWYSGL